MFEQATETQRELMKQVEYDMLELEDRATMYRRAMTTTDIDSVHKLSARMIDYVHVINLDGNAVRFSTLNRRFARAAKGLGVSVLSLTAFPLLMFRHKRGNVVMTADAARLMSERLEATCGPKGSSAYETGKRFFFDQAY